MYYWNRKTQKSAVIQEYEKMSEVNTEEFNSAVGIYYSSYRMMNNRIKLDSRLKFDFLYDMSAFIEFAFIIPDFYRCELCEKMVAFMDTYLVSNAYLCSDCKKEYVSGCNLCSSRMIDVSDFPANLLDVYHVKIKHPKMVRYNGKEQYLCTNCRNTKYTTCSDCGTVFLSNESINVNRLVFCQQCSKDKFCACKTCGAVKIKEHLINGQCSGCFMRSNSLSQAEVRNYGHKPTPVFISLLPSGMLPYYGIELEVDNGIRTDSLLRILARFKEIYLKDDGSLTSGKGFEIVSYPLTLDYHRNFMHWDEIFSAVESAGYKSHNAKNSYGDSNCGIHVHAGRTAFGESTRNQQKYMAYFVYLVHKFQPQLTKFSRRDNLKYCKFSEDYNLNGKPTKEFQKYVYYNKKHRNMVVNSWDFSGAMLYPPKPIVQLKTLETRLFRGTLNRASFIACIGLVDTLIKLALSVKNDEDLKLITWNDVKIKATIPELKDYIEKKRII